MEQPCGLNSLHSMTGCMWNDLWHPTSFCSGTNCCWVLRPAELPGSGPYYSPGYCYENGCIDIGDLHVHASPGNVDASAESKPSLSILRCHVWKLLVLERHMQEGQHGGCVQSEWHCSCSLAVPLLAANPSTLTTPYAENAPNPSSASLCRSSFPELPRTKDFKRAREPAWAEVVNNWLRTHTLHNTVMSRSTAVMTVHQEQGPNNCVGSHRPGCCQHRPPRPYHPVSFLEDCTLTCRPC
jgi:hypothetical protein